VTTNSHLAKKEDKSAKEPKKIEGKKTEMKA